MHLHGCTLHVLETDGTLCREVRCLQILMRIGRADLQPNRRCLPSVLTTTAMAL
jgi:hypothetical protein